MDDYLEIKRRVFDVLRALGRPVFDSRVPAGASFPFIRYSWIATSFNPAFKKADVFTRHRLQVDVVDRAEVATASEDLFKRVVGLLDGLTFQPAINKYLCHLVGVTRTYDEQLNLWYLTGEFLIHRV